MRARAKKWTARLLSVLFAAILLTGSVLAADGGTLNLEYTQEGAAFTIYRAATVEGGKYVLTEDFAASGAAIPGESWRDTAGTLAGWAASVRPAPAGSGVVAGGAVSFSPLEEGLYLVVGESTTSGNYRYTPVPFLALVSGREAVTAQVKSDRDPIGGGDEPDTYQVKKVWKDDGTADRPESVTVQLLRNGSISRTVTLDESNHWSYTWESRNGGWTVVELPVPEGYTVSVSRSGSTFTVTNTKSGSPDDPDPTPGPSDRPDRPDPTPGPSEDPDVPGPVPTGDPIDPGPVPTGGPDGPDIPVPTGSPDGPTPTGGPDGPDAPDTPSGPSLPQTGQLWWPAALLALCGGGLIALGLHRRKRGTDEQ